MFGLFRFPPRFALRAIVWAAGQHHATPAPVGAMLRRMHIGMKGVVMTLYDSGIDEGGVIHQRIGWDAKAVDLAES